MNLLVIKDDCVIEADSLVDVMIVSLTTQDIYRDQTVITITRLEI